MIRTMIVVFLCDPLLLLFLLLTMCELLTAVAFPD
jgi:hypothetical protein